MKTFMVYIFYLASFLSSVLLFSSCMHTMMVGHGTEHNGESSVVLEKEVIIGDVRSVAIIPPLKVGMEAVLSLQLTDTKTSQPLSEAEIVSRIRYYHTVDNQHSDSSVAGQTETEHEITMNLDMATNKQQGLYEYKFIPSQTGEHIVTFQITAIGDRKLEPAIIVEAKQMATATANDTHSMMQGTGDTISPYIIIGTVVMGAMMIGMLLIKGGLF